MSSGSNSIWLSLLDKKKGEVQDLITPQVRGIRDGQTFRNVFKQLCETCQMTYVPHWITMMVNSFINIRKLTMLDGFVPALSSLGHGEGLEGLRGCKAGAKLDLLVEYLARLNKTVPLLVPSVEDFKADQKVQEPLQGIFELYIAAFQQVSTLYSPNHTILECDPTKNPHLEQILTKTAREFQELRGRYTTMVNSALQDRATETSKRERASSQNSKGDTDHPESSRYRIKQLSFNWKAEKGSGAFGSVDEVQETSTRAVFARKWIKPDPRDHELTKKEVENEVQIMQKLHHPHIPTVLFHFEDPEDHSFSIFMLPIADKDLRGFLEDCAEKDYPPPMTTLIYGWFGCLLDALAYAHKLRVKHNDIKPANILIKNNQPYLTDFGLAKDYVGQDSSTSSGHNLHGTMVYRAPEKKPRSKYGNLADVFALGCVFSEMYSVARGKSLSEYRAYRTNDEGSMDFCRCLGKVFQWLRELEKNPLCKALVGWVSDDNRGEILAMMDENMDRRPTAQESLNHLRPDPTFFCME